MYASKATVGLSNLSLPLAWIGEKVFEKRDVRAFSVFIIVRAKNRAIESRARTTIEQNLTDLNFPESFIFDEQPADFNIQIEVYSTKLNSLNRTKTIGERLARSVGRAVGLTYRSKMQNEDAIIDSNLISSFNKANPTSYLIATVNLCLSDAAPNTRIYKLSLFSCAKQHGPPLYGHIRGRLVVQPESVRSPLISGILSIRELFGTREYLNIHCRLQEGIIQSTKSMECELSLGIHLNKNSLVHFYNGKSILVRISDNKIGMPSKQFVITTEHRKDMLHWMRMLRQQVDDLEVWGDFATSLVTLLTENSSYESLTLGRAGARKLYDQIQINDEHEIKVRRANSTCTLQQRGFASFSPSTYSDFLKSGRLATTVPKRRKLEAQTFSKPNNGLIDGPYVTRLRIGNYNENDPGVIRNIDFILELGEESDEEFDGEHSSHTKRSKDINKISKNQHLLNYNELQKMEKEGWNSPNYDMISHQQMERLTIEQDEQATRILHF